MNLVIKDAVWQIAGRIASAIGGFLVIKLITPYLGPLRFGDYSTILKYFAIWSAFADFGLYVIALKHLGSMKNSNPDDPTLGKEYGKFVSTRMCMIVLVYTLALIIAYFIPAYTSNPYLIRGLPLGMLFSASFMTAGILQIPLQLFWKMEQVSIALICARVGQLALLGASIYIRYAHIDFSLGGLHITPFILILSSVLLSGVIQGVYVLRQSNRYLPLQRTRDRSFTKHIISSNRQYGLAYYLSSFHTLVVLILLSILYPTSDGWSYTGTRALALALIEILLIIPSALGNSLIHKVAHTSTEEKKKHFGALMHLMRWIGGMVVAGFVRFATPIIHFIGGEAYLSTSTYIGSDYILPFLGIVISLSFIKQVFNYIFVSTDLQNKLLSINLGGVLIGFGIGLPFVMKRGLQGGIVMQLLLEACFMFGALRVAKKHVVLPHVSWRTGCIILVSTLILVIAGIHRRYSIGYDTYRRLLYGFLGVSSITLLSLPWLKKTMRQL